MPSGRCSVSSCSQATRGASPTTGSSGTVRSIGAAAVGSAVAGLVVASYGVRVGLLALAAMQVVGIVLGLLARARRPR